ncbi:MAG: hypothetical protein JXA11_05215 [Phycisphaerae bacterium]|nr:hypothetical protein [Phycisphaerae bacterium]
MIWRNKIPAVFLMGILGSSVLLGDGGAKRKDNRPPMLWRFFMHGIVDSHARQIDLESLFDSPAEAKKRLVKNRPIQNPFVQDSQPALQLGKRQSITLPKPLPVDLKQVRGKSLRVFFWCRGEKTGRVNSPNSYSDPPNMLLELEDKAGNRLSRTNWVVGTTGTFPWHCYYTDTFVPDTTAGIKAHFYNPYGTAYFARLRWEIRTSENDYSNDERQCPVTGGMASNVYYDELNRFFRWGYWHTRYPWNYFKGPAVGMVGQKYNITHPAGLRKYFQEKVTTDNDHMNHSLMYFASRYHFGRKRGLLPKGMDETWLAALAKLILDEQVPDTGYWGTRQTPRSMGITFHFVDGLFHYHSIRRYDREDSCENERSLGVKEIPRAAEIIRTTLSMQSTYTDESGKERLAAWPRCAYNFTTEPNSTDQRASLAVTMNAVNLLRLCERFVDKPTQTKVYDSIRQAIRYVLTRCVRDDGVWLQSDTDREPTLNDYMDMLLSASHYAERKVFDSIPSPQGRVKAAATTDGVKIDWVQPKENETSLRLYAAKPDADPKQLSEADLVGILQRRGDAWIRRDPLVVLWAMHNAAKKQWGGGLKNGSYLLVKATFAKNLPISSHARPLRINKLGDKALYASSCTWYGEESPPVRVEIRESK